MKAAANEPAGDPKVQMCRGATPMQPGFNLAPNARRRGVDLNTVDGRGCNALLSTGLDRPLGFFVFTYSEIAMPMSVTNTAAAGVAYGDIRVGECQVHQSLIDVSTLGSHDDAGGSLPVGLPILVSGAPVSGDAQVAFGLIGPEPVKLGAADHFGNVIIAGAVNRDMIEDNLGRVLSAHELTAIAATPAIRLV